MVSSDPGERAAQYQKRLDEFGRQLSELKIASDVEEAEVFDLWPEESEGVEMLAVLYQTATGETFLKEYRKPPDYDTAYDLVVLLQYAEVDPNSLDELLGTRVPIERQAGHWKLDWARMEATITTRRTEGEAA